MPVTHQISDDILSAYATGSLPEAFNVVVATHVSLSDDARARLETTEALGGALLECIEAVPLSCDSLASTMRRIAMAAPEPRKDTLPECAVLPAPVVEYVKGTLEDVKWRPLGRGSKQAILSRSKEATMRLLLIPAGAEMPDHGHHGTEMTLVLQGAFIDGDQRFARGDIEVVNEDTEHRPIADVGEDCICLVASNAKLKFSGFLPRIVQPFIGI